MGRPHPTTPAARGQAVAAMVRRVLTLLVAGHAHQYDCALYDMLDLALAQRLGVPLITADRKLQARVGHLPEVIWVTDYAATRPRADQPK